MKTFHVTAKRWAHGWELHIDKIGVTQSHGLADAEKMARDYIALDKGVPTDSFAVTITPEIGDGLDLRARKARDNTQAAIQAQKQAAEEARQLARDLKARGLTGRDIAKLLDVSPQRVSQLVAG